MLVLLSLFGCPYVSQPGLVDLAGDQDGDGSIAVRFGGPDCRDQDPSITVCDGDGDGHDSVRAGGDDCDDRDATVHPGADETCNERDDDCDGLIDNADPEVVGPVAFWVDADGDGSGDPGSGRVCQDFATPGVPSSGLHATDDDDCEDGDPSIGPHADELCDGIDNDCDGVTDDVGTWFVDADGDGYGQTGTQAAGSCVLEPGQGLAAVGGDCDDDDPAISPGATEIPYDGVDQDCDDEADDWDADGDGYVPGVWWQAMLAANDQRPAGSEWNLVRGDCDDEEPRAWVGGVEVCDGVDNDCDGRVDVEDLEGAAQTAELPLRAEVSPWYVDADGDGSFGTQVLLCPTDVDPALHRADGDDCFDGQSPAPAGFGGADPTAVNPGAQEVCDGFDNDCNGRVDVSFSPFPGSLALWYDGDGDGYGNEARFGCAVDPVQRLVDVGDDCNDASAAVYPGAPEICGDAIRQDCSDLDLFDCDGDGAQGTYVGGGDGADCDDVRASVNPWVTVELCDGLDNDCDGLVDSADVDDLDAGAQPIWYVDDDGDGYGVDDGSGQQACDQPPNRALQAGDCDDTDASVHPGTLWYVDADGDGHGRASSAIASCTQPAGRVTLGDDCDDTSYDRRPGAVWSFDADGDGYGDPAQTGTFCSPPPGEPWVQGSGEDCNDADALQNPGRPELAGNGMDDDCDGGIDNQSQQRWYPDADGDGYGDMASAGSTTWSPGRVANATDCDDSLGSVHPGVVVEQCNGRDDNCDGFAVDGDPDVSNPWLGVSLAASEGPPLFPLLDDNTTTVASIEVTIRTCSDQPGQLLSRPDGDYALTVLTAQDVRAATTCLDFSPGTLYARDRDGDGVPGIVQLEDVLLVCDGRTPPSYWHEVGSSDPLDCAPIDPARHTLVSGSAYADVDGDGAFAPWLLPEPVCAAASSSTAGYDCNDQDPDEQGTFAVGSFEIPGALLQEVMQICDQSELVLTSDASLDLNDNTLNTNTVRGTDRSVRLDLVQSFGRPLDLHLHGLTLGTAGQTLRVSGDWRFEDVALEPLDIQLAQMGKQLTIRDATLSGVSFQITHASRLEIQNSTIDVGFDADPGRLLDQGTGEAEFIGVDILGDTEGFEVDGGLLTVRDVHFEGAEQALDLRGYGQVDVDGLGIGPGLDDTGTSRFSSLDQSLIDLGNPTELRNILIDVSGSEGLAPVLTADAPLRLLGAEIQQRKDDEGDPNDDAVAIELLTGGSQLEGVRIGAGHVGIRSSGGNLVLRNVTAIQGLLDDFESVIHLVEIPGGQVEWSDSHFPSASTSYCQYGLFQTGGQVFVRDSEIRCNAGAVYSEGDVLELDRVRLHTTAHGPAVQLKGVDAEIRGSLLARYTGSGPAVLLENGSELRIERSTVYGLAEGVRFDGASSRLHARRTAFNGPFDCTTAQGMFAPSFDITPDSWWDQPNSSCQDLFVVPGHTPAVTVDPTTFLVQPPHTDAVGEFAIQPAP